MKRAFVILSAVAFSPLAIASLGSRDNDDPDAPKWAEETVQLPAYPLEGNLREFYVSAATSHRYFVDGTSLSVGKDGVVRYTLVIRTSGGASNISFEGMRCETGEYKIYATGHRDGTWSAVRRGEWRRIENKPVNRHHAALSRDFFCPVGNAILTPEEGREALRLGKHPSAN